MPDAISPVVAQKLTSVPDLPGAYIMRGEDGAVLYVGKALSLRKRLRQHFRESATTYGWTQQLYARVHDIDYTVTTSEVEALILEANLIKEHKPRYNIRLQDDKSYPYLKLTDETYPRLMVLRDLPRQGRSVVISPRRGPHWFHGLWLRGVGGDPEYASFRFPTASNPHIPPAEIATARRELPQRVFEQEFEAAFLDDGGAVFRRVREAATGAELPPYPGRFVIGVDWAKRDDYTVFVVLDVEARRVVALERFNQIDYALQTARLKALCERWRPVVVEAERNSIGEPLLEQLGRDGLPMVGFQTTAASKPRIIDDLALALERGELALPPHDVLLAELEAYTMEPTRTGHYRFGAPAGLHDDCVMALAIAWHARDRGVAESLAAWL